MHVISRKALSEFWARHPTAEPPLRAWFHEASGARWESSAELKARYPSASILSADRVVFNVGGNRYRLVVRIHYAGGTVFVRFVGTHREYDRIDAETV